MDDLNGISMPYFTVFTPVYNGEKHIHRIFESISLQDYTNFEWIVVNDGSSDGTAALIKAFIKNHPEIDINYIEQKNSGKHIAWNKAVKLARGKLFVPADADDSFMPETLSFFYEIWQKLTLKEQLSLSGINVLCLDNDTDSIVGDKFPKDGMWTNNLKLMFKYKITGEKWGCIRTDLLRNRLFPVIKGSHFPENYLWFHFSKRYNVICYNIALRRYYTTATGIIQSQLRIKNDPVQNKVTLKYSKWLIRNFGLFLLINSPLQFLRLVFIIVRSSLFDLIGND